MTARDLQRWRFELSLNQSEAAEALGLSVGTVSTYERGTQKIPRTVALACAWLERQAGLGNEASG